MSTAQPANFLITLLLGKYAEKKGLTVNTAKSEVVHFNSEFVSPLQNPFTYDGVVLPEKDRFKYLGMLLDRRMNPKIAEEQCGAALHGCTEQDFLVCQESRFKKQASCYALVV